MSKTRVLTKKNYPSSFPFLLFDSPIISPNQTQSFISFFPITRYCVGPPFPQVTSDSYRIISSSSEYYVYLFQTAFHCGDMKRKKEEEILEDNKLGRENHVTESVTSQGICRLGKFLAIAFDVSGICLGTEGGGGGGRGGRRRAKLSVFTEMVIDWRVVNFSSPMEQWRRKCDEGCLVLLFPFYKEHRMSACIGLGHKLIDKNDPMSPLPCPTSHLICQRPGREQNSTYSQPAITASATSPLQSRTMNNLVVDH